MSRSGEVTIRWGDGEDYAFRLAIKQLEELQDKCDAGPNAVLQRLFTGAWKVGDIAQTIRLGLIGGGLTPAQAGTLTRRYVEDRPLAESVPVAQAVLMAAIFGTPDEELERPAGEAEGADATTEKSTSPPTTD